MRRSDSVAEINPGAGGSPLVTGRDRGSVGLCRAVLLQWFYDMSGSGGPAWLAHAILWAYDSAEAYRLLVTMGVAAVPTTRTSRSRRAATRDAAAAPSAGFAFEFCCDVVGLDPGAVRQAGVRVARGEVPVPHLHYL